MSNNQNTAQDIIKAWQDHLQNSMQDTRLMELMAENYAQFQNFIDTTSKSTASDVPSNGAVELNQLREHVAALESRIQILEKLAAGNKRKK
ncbi:MAG: hypothetical protein ACHP6I_02005 [Rickettsiales bacterium]